MLKPAILLALMIPLAAQANFAKCLLDRLPGMQNDVAANAIWRSCNDQNPGGFTAVKQGSGRGWFSFKSGDECTAKKAGDTRSQRAAALISSACRRLYDEPLPFDPRTARPVDQFDPRTAQPVIEPGPTARF